MQHCSGWWVWSLVRELRRSHLPRGQEEKSWKTPSQILIMIMFWWQERVRKQNEQMNCMAWDILIRSPRHLKQFSSSKFIDKESINSKLPKSNKKLNLGCKHWQGACISWVPGLAARDDQSMCADGHVCCGRVCWWMCADRRVLMDVCADARMCWWTCVQEATHSHLWPTRGQPAQSASF